MNGQTQTSSSPAVNPLFMDRVFAAGSNWNSLPAPDGHRQRYLLQWGKIFTETEMTLPGSPAEVLSRLTGPWAWWRKGNNWGFRECADGGTEQMLSPVWWNWIHVRLRTLAVIAAPEPGGIRLPIRLDGGWAGWASFDLFETGAGSTMVRGRFHGVSKRFPFVADDLAARLHLQAEAGTLPFPFPSGTGLVGLEHELRAASESRLRPANAFPGLVIGGAHA